MAPDAGRVVAGKFFILIFIYSFSEGLPSHAGRTAFHAVCLSSLCLGKILAVGWCLAPRRPPSPIFGTLSNGNKH